MNERYCLECEGTEVHALAWVDFHRKFMGYVGHGTGEKIDYCLTCDKRVDTRSTYAEIVMEDECEYCKESIYHTRECKEKYEKTSR